MGFYSEIVVLGLAVLNKLMRSISELQVCSLKNGDETAYLTEL